MPPPPNSAIAIYTYFMDEIKERLDAATQTVVALRSGSFPFVEYIGAEFCLLQLRMIYELIALGSVVMHEKMGALRDEWHAGDIMKRLSRLHPEFYPQPVVEKIDGDTINLQAISEPYLTKETLIDRYGKLGDKLHRGRSSDILLKRPRVYDLDDVVEQLNLTVSLLDYHYIAMASPRHFVRVALSDPGDGKVKVNAWIPTD